MKNGIIIIDGGSLTPCYNNYKYLKDIRDALTEAKKVNNEDCIIDIIITNLTDEQISNSVEFNVLGITLSKEKIEIVISNKLKETPKEDVLIVASSHNYNKMLENENRVFVYLNRFLTNAVYRKILTSFDLPSLDISKIDELGDPDWITYFKIVRRKK